MPGHTLAGLPPGRALVGLAKDEGVEAAIRWLAETGVGRRSRTYRLRDWRVIIVPGRIVNVVAEPH
jgi:hypothetical protein